MKQQIRTKSEQKRDRKHTSFERSGQAVAIITPQMLWRRLQESRRARGTS